MTAATTSARATEDATEDGTEDAIESEPRNVSIKTPDRADADHGQGASGASPQQTDGDLGPSERLKQIAQTLIVAAIDAAAGKIGKVVDAAAGQLERVVSDIEGGGSGIGMGAALGAGKAIAAGANPLWGAVKGAWSTLGVGAKVGIVLGLVLLAVLSPVALLVVLIGLLVAAIVKSSRG